MNEKRKGLTNTWDGWKSGIKKHLELRDMKVAEGDRLPYAGCYLIIDDKVHLHCIIHQPWGSPTVMNAIICGDVKKKGGSHIMSITRDVSRLDDDIFDFFWSIGEAVFTVEEGMRDGG